MLGIIFSYILKCTKFYKNDVMYLDESKTLVNSDLFLPPIAKLISKRNEKIQSSINTNMKNVDQDRNKY